MIIDKIINKAHSILINGILSGISETDKEEVSNNYLNHLFSQYSKKEATKENARDILKGIIIRENKIWGNMDAITRLKLLKRDKSYDKISEISEQGFTLASLRLEDSSNTISSFEAEKNIDILIGELNNVNDYNLEDAKTLVSEGILDYKYASGNDELMSFRLYDTISFQK